MARSIASNTPVDREGLLEFARPCSEGKCLVRLTPQRWGPIATGGFPARLA